MASKKNFNYKDRIIRMVDVPSGDPSLGPLFDEFIAFWAKNYPDKPRWPKYFDMWLEEKYGIQSQNGMSE